jgi:beta-phosphoglucomutase-like phosphatase (HAD superfamily)
MDTEIAETKERRSQERLAEYEREKRATLAEEEESGISIQPNSRVQRLMDESQAEYDQQDASRAQLDEFLAYEAEAFKKAASREAEEEQQEESTSWQRSSSASSSSSSNILKPGPEADLDQWALERLEAMSNRVDEDVDGSEMVQDLLDESVTDLRQRMDKESSQRRVTKPETLKEWQMYRAIATRLAADIDKENENDDDDDDDDESARVDSSEMVSDEEILGRLQSWKEYVVKEDRIRTEGGLTRGPKMPFAWQEGSSTDASTTEKVADTRSKSDVRKQINRMSIEAMESMLANADGARRVKLQAEIDYLKSELEGKDYLDFIDPEEDEIAAGPVDMTGVFQSYDPTGDEDIERNPRPTMPSQSFSQSTTPVSPQQPPPSTPFFDDVNVREEVTAQARQKPPPNTPFFSESQSSSVGTGDSKLGSIEEQKLQAMYRRANARTREEQDRIRSQWEEFQQLEKTKREESGLGGSVVDDDLEESSRRAQEAAAAGSAAAASRKYNVEDVVSKDGEIDAAKILSAIGPRPGRSKKEAKTEEGEEKDAAFKSSVDKREVEDSLYRSVSAVGGGRWKDSDFLRREREMRQSLDQPMGTADGNESPNETTSTTFDEARYAAEAMASLGPRPKTPRTRKVDARELSDNGGVRGLQGESTDQDDEADDDDDDEDDERSTGSESAAIPEWLLRENAANKPKRKRFLNMEDIDEAFDDDQYEKNMRQLAEYERRRAGNQQRQMGIDISDALGRRDTEDYKDYKYDDDYTRGRRGGGFGAVSFEGRKANLLGYTELEVVELNSLMDNRDSVHTTGVSQYLPRINKPFKEFGAIFRIEGVLVDLTGLQLQAWTKVAEAHGLNPPLVEDVRLAAVTQPELAVNHIFVWTDNWLECSKIALTHRRVFSEVFDNWVKENNISTQQALEQPAQRGSLALGEEVVQQQASPSPPAWPVDEREMLDQITRAWTQTAYKLARSAPSQAEILATVSLSPDLAVKKVFRWTVDQKEVDEIVELYHASRRMISGGGGGSEDAPNAEVAPKAEPVIKPAPFVLNEAGMMELHYLSWTRVAEMFNFDRPTTDEVLGAFVLNDPSIAVRNGFEWTTNEQQVKDVVNKFSSTLNALIKEKTSGVSPPAQNWIPEPQSAKQQDSPPAPPSPRQGPSKEDIIEMHAQAWVLAATNHRFSLPTLEQVQLAMDMTAEDAVRKIFGWTGNEIELQRAASEFREELKRVSDNYVRKHNLDLKPTPVASSQNTQQGPSVSADDMYQAAFNAWSATASRYGFVWPIPGQVIYAMSVGPEEAIASGFGWADTQERLNEILEAYKEELAKQRIKYGFGETKATATAEKSSEPAIPPVQVNAGAAKWIRSLLDVEMQCATISYLDRMQVNVLLEFAGLSDLIASDKRVSIGDGYNRDSQQMLGAALRVERRPDHCVVFDASPYASIAAHDVEMRNVAMIDPYPRYELLSADQTSSGFEELTAMNIRRLFGERIYDQPMLDMQQTEPVTKKKQKTKFFWEGDD